MALQKEKILEISIYIKKFLLIIMSFWNRYYLLLNAFVIEKKFALVRSFILKLVLT